MSPEQSDAYPASGDTLDVPLDRMAVYFVDDTGCMWTLDHYVSDLRVPMTKRQQALALALLDVARRNVVDALDPADANDDYTTSGGEA